MKSNPSAGTVRIMFIGYDLSPQWGTPFHSAAKVTVSERKPIPFNLFYFAWQKVVSFILKNIGNNTPKALPL